VRLGPDNATLSVKTKKGGVASKAGHDLTMEVTSWEATLDDDSIVLTADAHSFRLIEATGGAFELGDEEKAAIPQTIREEVLTDPAIEFRSTSVQDGAVRGDLTIGGTARPVAFDLSTAGGRLTGRAVVKQTDFGMKPYTALFGTLKVADEVEVLFEAKGDASG
jgi:YceI-like domain